MSTKIEWTNETWNPVVGCSKVSPGCMNCYAERMARRFFKKTGVVDRHGWTGNMLIKADNTLNFPLHWRRPRMIFAGSMTDFFHPNVPLSTLRAIFNVMYQTPHHTYQILTKRPEEMRYKLKVLGWHQGYYLKNVWLGVTVEDQERAKRIESLLGIPAAKRFVSVEPQLGPVDLSCYLPGLDWVISGGETGAGARPFKDMWIQDMIHQCYKAGVPFFFKQRNKKGDNLIDGIEHHFFPMMRA